MDNFSFTNLIPGSIIWIYAWGLIHTNPSFISNLENLRSNSVMDWCGLTLGLTANYIQFDLWKWHMSTVIDVDWYTSKYDPYRVANMPLYTQIDKMDVYQTAQMDSV